MLREVNFSLLPFSSEVISWTWRASQQYKITGQCFSTEKKVTCKNLANLEKEEKTTKIVTYPLFLLAIASSYTFYETNFKPKLFTEQYSQLTTQKRKGHSFSKFKFSLNCGDLVFWFTFDFAVHCWPKMVLMLEILSDYMYLGIALATQFSSSLLVLGVLNLHSTICIAKHRVHSELTNS